MKAPRLKIEHVEDLYTLYVLVAGIDCKTFWHDQIASVERIYANKLAFDSWQNSLVGG